MAFMDQLSRLDFRSYSEYLHSPHWEMFRQRYAASMLPKVCAVCGSSEYQLHHVSYKRLGAEELGDVTPLCDWHHGEVHQWLEARNRGVDRTMDAIQSLRSAYDKAGNWPERRRERAREVPTEESSFASQVMAGFHQSLGRSHPIRSSCRHKKKKKRKKKSRSE